MYEVKQVQDTKTNNKLRWLATNINLDCYTMGVLSLMKEPCRLVLKWAYATACAISLLLAILVDN